jgi:coenzyme F420-reducing hydrogenase alpha subunit
MSGKARRRTIRVDPLARVEGEGALLVRVRDGQVHEVKLKIPEPPRFFEAFLRGREFTEAPDITARICGICPVAYQMSACHAMEAACGVRVDGPLRELRRLLYCGEWIESHALHIYLLHAPDFLGYDSAIHMAGEHREAVERGLRLKKLGNDLLDLLGGRAVHPVNVRVGGFYRTPSRAELERLVEPLQRGVEEARQTVDWVAGFDFPELEQECESVALRHPGEYPFNEGRLVGSSGLDIDIEEYELRFRESHVRHSNALHTRLDDGGAFLVGPLARYNLNHDRLTPACREAAASAGLGTDCRNPFRSIIVRAVELLYACEEALRIVRAAPLPPRPAVEVRPRAGTGQGCTEAPRGSLYHRYQIDAGGKIVAAKIVAPTSQNQPIIESDLRRFVEGHLELPDDELTWRCEQVVRNYDPCISCATHFLKLRIERE